MSKRLALVAMCGVIAWSMGCAEQDPEFDAELEPTLARAAPAPAAAGFSTLAWEEIPGKTSIDDLLVEGGPLDELAGRGLSLQLHWPAEAIRGNPDADKRWRVVDRAYALGIPVQTWITLPEGSAEDHRPGSPNYARTGYFPGATNWQAFTEAANALMDEWLERGLPATTMVVDLEMRRERLRQLSEILSAGDIFGGRAFLRAEADAAGPAYDRALQGYKDWIDHAHALGFKVNATTLLPILDDFVDGDDTLRRGFNVPLDQRGNWDKVYFQAQRTLYRMTFPLGPYFVYSYGLMARRFFGAKAGLDLGLTDAGGEANVPLYGSPVDLRQDLEAARSAGFSASSLGLYSFGGMYIESRGPGLRQYPVAQWLVRPGSSAPLGWRLTDGATELLHLANQSLD